MMPALLDTFKVIWILSGFVSLFIGLVLYALLIYGTFISISTIRGVLVVGNLLLASLTLGFGLGTILIWLIGI